MSRLVYLDAVGGAAGDMILAALLDAGADEAAVRRAVDAVVPGRFLIGKEEVRRAGLRATFLRVEDGPASSGRGLTPRPGAELRAAIDGADLSAPVRAAALAMLDRLLAAEAAVHGDAEPDLHELGDDDTLLDAVGVAAALDDLGALAADGRANLFASSLPVAAGETVATAHGELPVPTPVTLELLRGFELRGAARGELVTPTAAAILAALATPAESPPAMTLRSVGTGAGARDPADHPNVVRAWIGDAPDRSDDRGPPRRDLVVLEVNLDDLSPELVADAASALLAAGALDAWTTPVQMKKGRPGVVLSALAEPVREAALTRVFFEATSTFGVRSYPVHRRELERRTVRVELAQAGGSVRVKVGLLGGRVVSAKPEHDDLAELAASTGLPVRVIHEEAASAARELRFTDAEDPR